MRAMPWIGLGAFLLAFGAALVTAGLRTGPVVEPGIEVVEASVAQEELVAGVLVDLEREGLLAELASERVEISFTCRLHPVGLAQRRGETWHVHVCRQEAWVVAHELAHVYVESAVGPEARRVLLAGRGLTTWADGTEGRWQDLGAEHAAEIIRWGVTGYGTEIGVRGSHDPATLARHYELLAGRPPSWWTGRIAQD